MWPGLSKARSLLSRWRQGRAASINPKSVVKDVQPETEASAGYFLALSVANLIALCGLHTNSLAVIIGAMLITGSRIYLAVRPPHTGLNLYENNG